MTFNGRDLTVSLEKGTACLEEAEFNQPDKPEWLETE